MSTVVRPSGRLPPRVYWLRRGLLLAVVVLSGLGLARCAGVGMGDQAARPAGPPKAADTVAAAGLGAPASTGPPRSGSLPSRGRSSLRRVRPELGPPVGACDPAATAVQPGVDGPAAGDGGTVLQLRLTVAAEQPCRLSLVNRLLVQVAKDGEALWSLTDCPSALTTETLVLHPGWVSVVDVTWSGRVSNSTCSLETAHVRPGTYQLEAALLAGEPRTVDLKVLAPESASAAGPRRAGQT